MVNLSGDSPNVETKNDSEVKPQKATIVEKTKSDNTSHQATSKVNMRSIKHVKPIDQVFVRSKGSDKVVLEKNISNDEFFKRKSQSPRNDKREIVSVLLVHASQEFDYRQVLNISRNKRYTPMLRLVHVFHVMK